MNYDILICGVGGQNVQPYLDFFYKLAVKLGEHIYVDYKDGFSKERCSERYSIRIGSGFGDILEGKADAVICLEQLEAVKSRFFPKESGGMVVSKKRILPSSVLNGATEYPTDCMQKCVNDCFKVFETEGEDYLLDCFLCIRIIGFEKEETVGMFKDDFGNPNSLLQAYQQRYVKA